MTEKKWLAATNLTLMLAFLKSTRTNRTRSGRRRLRLFGCGCTRRVYQLLTERGRSWLNQAERLADDMVSEEERQQFEKVNSKKVDTQLSNGPQSDMAAWYMLGTKILLVASSAMRCAAEAIAIDVRHRGGNADAARTAEVKAQVDIMRDIFGNLFRPVTVDPRWQTETVIALAAGIYEDRAFERMPILADALQEAGCENELVLQHCREPGQHVRGCWVVDLLLGKQ